MGMPAQSQTRADIEREIARRREQLGAAANDWVPNPGPQTRFLQSSADEALYGGAAGGSKTESLLVAALRYVHVPGYRAILFRRQGTQLTKQLIPRARLLYRRLFPRGQVRWHATDRRFTFPSGATIEFGAADKEQHIERWQGFEFAFIAFDELTAFTRYQYTFMFSRLRSTVAGLPTRMRAGTNPGGPGHEWVLRRWAPWLYPLGHIEYNGQRARDGEPLWMEPIEDSDEERIAEPGTPTAISRTFFSSRVSDTPQLGEEYERKNLSGLDRLTRKRLKDGDWMARAVAGEFFERGWFEIVNAGPRDVLLRLRYWDLAGTSEKHATPSTAYTAGLLMSVSHDGVLFIEHVLRAQLSPGEVEQTIERTLAADRIEDDGVITIIERDPAQSGKFQAWYFGRKLGIKAIPPNGNKLSRALIASAQAEAGNIKIVRGLGSVRWIEPFLREAESFPEDKKDQIDALSGAVRFALLKIAKMLGRR